MIVAVFAKPLVFSYGSTTPLVYSGGYPLHGAVYPSIGAVPAYSPVYKSAVAAPAPITYVAAQPAPIAYHTGSIVKSLYEPVEQHGYQIAY